MAVLRTIYHLVGRESSKRVTTLERSSPVKFLMSLFVAVKKRNNWHRHDYTEPDDGSKPVQAGTPVFIKELQNRTFARYI